MIKLVNVSGYIVIISVKLVRVRMIKVSDALQNGRSETFCFSIYFINFKGAISVNTRKSPFMLNLYYQLIQKIMEGVEVFI